MYHDVHFIHKTLNNGQYPRIVERDMENSTGPPPQRQAVLRRTYTLLIAVFVLSITVFGYGFGVIVRLLPAGWGISGIVQYIALIIGALLSSLVALIAAWLWRQEQPQTLTSGRAIRMGTIASAMALGVTILSYRLRVGEVEFPRSLGWTLIGCLGMSTQFAVGTIEPRRRRWLTLLVECGIIFAAVFAFITLNRGSIPPSSYSFLAGGASVLLLVSGGPLYLLGSHLSELPR